ncbi:MAG: AbgT family transporter [Bacteroides sp.]|nr:AbgT family transporter [Bacteroides sp.]
MKSKWHMPHPATMFLLLTGVVVFLSWICDVYGLQVVHPQTGEEIRVQNLLSPEGIRWWLKHVITNFTGFAPVGMVIVAMFGFGLAEHSGLTAAFIRRKSGAPFRKDAVIVSVVLLGLVSNVVGDAGYVIMLSIAATLFHAAGLHPVAGIVTAYVSVACGYSANVFIGTLDPLLSGITQEAAYISGMDMSSYGPLSNYYFMAVSTFLLLGIIYLITRRSLLPTLGAYRGEVKFEGYRKLTRKERRALLLAVVVGLGYLLLILLSTFSSWGILRGVNGGLVRSPFLVGILFLLSLGVGLMGTVYGFSSGRYRSDSDVVEGLAQPMKMLGVYFVIAFFAAQLFACLEYTQLDQCLSIVGADLLSAAELPAIGILILFILFTSTINLIIPSASTKWAFMAFIFIPVLGRVGVAPEVVQCAFRIGDSATNAVTPFLFYVPLVLTCMQQYDKESTYGTLLRYTWKYSLIILLVWSLLFIGWYLLGIPLGL